mgnify:CR=1 FL=1
MPEIAMARRSGVLDQLQPIRKAGFSALPQPPAGRLSIRLGNADGVEAGGLDLACPLNRVVTAGTRLAARLGPDEWLIVVAAGDEQAVAKELGAALAGGHCTMTDISHRNTAFEVAGAAADAVLAAGCPLDLERVPQGFATRTLLGKAEIVLIRLGDAPDGTRRYRIECWRSFGRYLHAFLTEAAAG